MMLLLLIFDLMFVTSGKKLLIGAILIGVHTEILPVRVLDSGMRHDRSDLWTLDRMSDMHTFEDLCNSAHDESFTTTINCITELQSKTACTLTSFTGTLNTIFLTVIFLCI